MEIHVDSANCFASKDLEQRTKVCASMLHISLISLKCLDVSNMHIARWDQFLYNARMAQNKTLPLNFNFSYLEMHFLGRRMDVLKLYSTFVQLILYNDIRNS